MYGESLVTAVAMDRVAKQWSQIDSLDGKCASLLGFGSALLGVLAAGLAIREGSLGTATVILLSIAGVIYLALAGLCLRAYAPREWKAAPELDRLWEFARKYSLQEQSWRVAEGYTQFYLENRPRLLPKILAARVGAWLLAAETLVVTAALAVAASS